MAASKARNVAATAASSGAPSRRARLNADTSSEPEGLTRRVVLNILEAFFQRPWLHLLPLILMIALGAATAFSTEAVYKSSGVITAESSTLIGNITQSNNQGFGYETPATATARNINEMLQTNEFLTSVANKLQADAPENQLPLLRRTIADSVGATADGDQLVRVTAQSARSDLSFRLADATVQSYLEAVIDNDLRQSSETVTLFEGEVEQARADLQAAQDALDQFLVDNQIDGTDETPLALELQANRMQDGVDRLASTYDAKLDALDQAKLATNTARTEVEQRLRLTDPPEQPEAPEPRLRKAGMTLVVFGILGSLLSLASVIVASALDKTIRVPADVNAKFGLDVLAVIPNARGR